MKLDVNHNYKLSKLKLINYESYRIIKNGYDKRDKLKQILEWRRGSQVRNEYLRNEKEAISFQSSISSGSVTVDTQDVDKVWPQMEFLVLFESFIVFFSFFFWKVHHYFFCFVSSHSHTLPATKNTVTQSYSMQEINKYVCF